MTALHDNQRAEALQRYLANQVETASPAQRLLMLQGQLLSDLRAVDEAFGTMAIEPIHHNLVHAQEIVLALRDSLNGSEWAGASSLQAVYGFVHQRLVTCNVDKDRSLLPYCVQLLEQIFEANAKAAAALTRSAPAEHGEVAHAV
ncbi:MAG: flagellar export chaperone FliS [Acidimicrobiales bacterium]